MSFSAESSPFHYPWYLRTILITYFIGMKGKLTLALRRRGHRWIGTSVAPWSLYPPWLGRTRPTTAHHFRWSNRGQTDSAQQTHSREPPPWAKGHTPKKKKKRKGDSQGSLKLGQTCREWGLFPKACLEWKDNFKSLNWWEITMYSNLSIWKGHSLKKKKKKSTADGLI